MTQENLQARGEQANQHSALKPTMDLEVIAAKTEILKDSGLGSHVQKVAIWLERRQTPPHDPGSWRTMESASSVLYENAHMSGKPAAL